MHGFFSKRVTSLLCTQVVDFWAFSTSEWGKEIMSMHHTRNALQKMTPQVRLPSSPHVTHSIVNRKGMLSTPSLLLFVQHL